MGKDIAKVKQTFMFCDGSSCQKAGSELAVRSARAYVRNNGLWNNTHTIKTRCNGRCEDAPTWIVQPGNHWYKEMDAKKAKEVAIAHVNNTCIPDYLLFKEGAESMQTENEREAVVVKPFELLEDTDLGTHYLTKGFSSDQYLYPLFVYLSDNKIDADLKIQHQELFNFKTGVTVLYNSIHEIVFETATDKSKKMIIGAVSKKDTEEVQFAKITSTQYIAQIENAQKKIRFRNKKGALIAELTTKDDSFWNYCLKIQLGGLELPKFAKS